MILAPRNRFLEIAREQIGRPVLWANRGPEAFDCSGLVGYALELAGLSPSVRFTHNAQALADQCAQVATPAAGDLCFYGHDASRISHVAILLEDGRALSADGATSHITTLAVALANPANRVRVHTSWKFRGDEPFAIILRNSWVTAAPIIPAPPPLTVVS